MGRYAIWNMHLALITLVMWSALGCTIDLSISQMASTHLAGPNLSNQLEPGDFPIGKTDFLMKEVVYYLPTIGGHFFLSDSTDPHCRYRTVDANFQQVSCFDAGKLLGATVDAAGNIYGGNNTTYEVKKFDKDGNLLLSFGGNGTGNGQFGAPYDTALDASGNIYVVDRTNNRVQKFDSAGNFILTFGSLGSGDGQFSQPTAVEINPDGDVLVADGNNPRIQKFSPLGVFISKFGSAAVIDGALGGPQGLAVDSTNGDVYVADFFQSKIIKYDAAGTFLWKTGNGELTRAASVALINGEVVVPDLERMAYFSTAGVFLREKKPQGSPFQSVTALAMSSNHHFYVGDGAQIKELDYQGSLIRSFGSFSYVGGIALDSDGNIFATDTMAGNLLKYSPSGTLLGTYSSSGVGPAQLNIPTGVFIYADIVYVCDTYNMRIQKFSLTGVHLGSFGDAAGPGYINKPTGITLGSDHHFYISAMEAPVFKYDFSGNFVTTFGTYQVDNSATDFSAAMGIFADPDGQVFVVDRVENRVTKFDTAGTYLGTIGAFGGASGYFHNPIAITGDEFGNLYLAEIDNQRIQKFNSLGVVQDE